MAQVDWNPEAWGSVFSHGEVGTFVTHSEFAAGVHQVTQFDGSTLEFLVDGDLAARGGWFLVVYGGAVSSRLEEGKVGPYFSGRGLAERTGFPLVSFSDPTLAEDPDISIAWYTGLMNSNSQAVQARVIRHLAETYGKRPLLVGGSAGGFAALSAAARIRDSRTLVWNPQTNFMHYNQFYVRKYLSVLTGRSWEHDGWKPEAGKLLRTAKITNNLDILAPPKDVLVLQNEADWHLAWHFVPYMKHLGLEHVGNGAFGEGAKAGLVSHWGSEHTSPPVEVIEQLVLYLTSEGATPAGAVQLLDEGGLIEHPVVTRYPIDLRADADAIAETVTTWARIEGDRLVAGIDEETRNRWQSLVLEATLNGDGRVIRRLIVDSPAHATCALTTEDASRENLHVEYVLRDRLMNKLASLSVQVSR